MKKSTYLIKIQDKTNFEQKIKTILHALKNFGYKQLTTL